MVNGVFKRPVLIFLIFIIIALGCKITYAEVLDFNITPEKPVKGDLVEIFGKAKPDEEIAVKIQFEKTVPVKEGEYSLSINGLKIPEKKNKFTVTAQPCDNLKVSVKILFNLIWVTLGSDSKDQIATVSQSNVPAGTYDVLIHGKSSHNSVKLNITAIGYIKADENGNFSYTYNTTPMPAGDFIVSVGGKTKTIKLEEKQSLSIQSSNPSSNPPNSPKRSSSPPKTINQATPNPTPTPAVTPTVTPTPISPTPKPLPSAPPTPAISPPKRASENTTDNTVSEHNSSKTQAAILNKSTDTGTKNSTINYSTQIPGFDAVIALLTLSITLLVKKRRF